MLIHHAAELLLRQGHRVTFLLDVPLHEFVQFMERDRLLFSNPQECTAYHVGTLCSDLPYHLEQVSSWSAWQSLRFAHAFAALLRRDRIDFAEFVDYCGLGYYAMVDKVYARDTPSPVLGVRLHNSIELIDRYGATRELARERHRLYGLERSAIRLAEVVLAPTWTYYEKHYRSDYNLDPRKVVVSQSPKLGFARVRCRPGREGPFSILYFGRLMQFKGVDQLIHAAVALFERHGELRGTVELVGPDSTASPFADSYVKYLETLVPAALRERFIFRGALSHTEMPDLLDHVLFAVFPNRFESFCYALHEIYDAGVPVIVNDLAGVADFFHHEQNALVYNGTTSGLLEKMERLVFDDELRERLARPSAVADQPLGDYYGRPVALAPLRDDAQGRARGIRGLCVVLARTGSEPRERTLDALRRQTDQAFDVVCLTEARSGHAETLWWLGTPWRVHRPDGVGIPATQIVARDALAILEAGDRPDPEWFERSARVLGNRSEMAFTGTWLRREGRVIPSWLDIAPELHPFEQGCRLTRALVRTQPGQLLVDVLDPDLGALGEIGFIWKTVAAVGPGCLLPQPLLEIAAAEPPALDTYLLAFLVARYGSPFAGRLSLLVGYADQQPDAGGDDPLVPAVGQHMGSANQLDGRTLLRLASRKLVQKLGLKRS
jgi:glycosyltransferase involved in cell wall biosynthesis